MNPFEMIVIIVFLSVGAGVINNLIKGREEKRTASESALADELREQILALEDRVRVLERIVTDTSGREDLHRQFRELGR
jgi:hypothetical protein